MERTFIIIIFTHPPDVTSTSVSTNLGFFKVATAWDVSQMTTNYEIYNFYPKSYGFIDSR